MTHTITRADLAKSIYSEVGISVAESNRLVQLVFEEIIHALSTEEYVKIANFGSFHVKNKGKRVGRNPRTLESFEITPRKVVSFYPAQLLKYKVNK